MRTPFIAISLCWLVQSSVAESGTAGTCGRVFHADFESGGEIRMEVRSGDVDIVGAASSAIKVSCELKRSDRAKDVKISFKAAGKSGDLRISGGPNNDVKIRIEVPKNSNLYVRVPAGDLDVSGVSGDKDVELHAGDLTISVGDANDYKHADAAVKAGDLNAAAFGVTKGGLFRSFQKDNPAGKYRLHANLGAGDLTLK
jgi:hypothetical protein